MALFKFDRDFEWWGLDPNRKCKLCKALSLWAFKKRDAAIDVPDEAAIAAEAAGVGKRVNYEAMQQ